MQKLIVANWKLHTLPLAPWKKLRPPRNIRVVICPPFPYLKEVRQFVSRRVAVGAQDVFWEENGPYTGEVSPAMIKNLGAEYVIIGHSERRKWLKETDEMINKKVKVAHYAGLKVILCVGEPKQVRRKGMTAAKNFIKSQLKKDLSGVSVLLHKENQRRSAFSPRGSAILIAYEPIWAIGTGVPDNPKETVEMARFIRATLTPSTKDGSASGGNPYALNPAILYGGSVNGKNAQSFLHYKEIDGALVGGASLKIKEFEKIIRAVGA